MKEEVKKKKGQAGQIRKLSLRYEITLGEKQEKSN